MKTYLFFIAFFLVVSVPSYAQTVAVATAPAHSTTTVKTTPITPEKKATPVFVPNVETHASYIGGISQLSDYLYDNLVYPELGRENGIEGTVLVELTIAENGDVQYAHVVKGPGMGFDKEALRLINEMPAWIPAQQGVRPVASKIRIPIAFIL
jgi:protein TonB